MKFLSLMLIFISFSALSNNDEYKNIYLSFESDYMSNNPEKYSRWLTNQYEIVRTMHAPNLGSDSLKLTGQQMIGFMKMMNKPNTTTRSTVENISIILKDNTSFCAASSAITAIKLSNKNVTEKETREVCFLKVINEFKVVEHKVNTFYENL